MNTFCEHCYYCHLSASKTYRIDNIILTRTIEASTITNCYELYLRIISSIVRFNLRLDLIFYIDNRLHNTF